jgi:hypothetical protein
MTHRSLAEVNTRLEKAVQFLPEEPADNTEEFERYEYVAIAILDSEHTDFPPGVLQEYLATRMYLRQLELGLIPFPSADHS